jgi:hypothetical protein
LRIVSRENILDDDKYQSIMSWFENHKFYLSQVQCDEINKIKRECNEKERKDIYRGFILWNDLKSNPEMDDSYFLDEG